MTPQYEQKTMHSAWTIPSIIKGLNEVADDWNLFAPKSEPFWSELSDLKSVRRVYASCRGVTLACELGKPAVVFVPNRQLSSAIKYASKAEINAPLILVIEDHPPLAPFLFPRESAIRANLCVVEPSSPGEVSHCAVAAARLSVCSSRPVVFIAHHGLLGASATVDAQDVTKTISPKQSSESIDPIQLGRKLELNRQRTLPSPGEIISVGFITIGLSDSALKYLVSELQLFGRVPMLNIRFINPLDTVPVERLLSRCRHVVVLEPRPGEVEKEIISIAQSMQREGREVAAIWGKDLPPLDPEMQPVKVPNDSLHPSVVARLTQHLLHEAKPSAQISSQLNPELPQLDVLSTRRMSFGTESALDLLRHLAYRILKDIAEDYCYVIDGVRLGNLKGKSIYVETWGEQNFITEGADVVRDARTMGQTRILIVWRSGETGKTLSMIADSMIPNKNDEKHKVSEVSLDDGEELDSAIQSASQRQGVSIIIVHDGAEPKFDIEQIEEAAAEVDKRGFRPQHAIVIPIEQMASVRLDLFETAKHKAGTPAMPLESRITTRLVKPQKRKWRISLRPILERVEVTRTKPPVRVISATSKRLSPPQPIHASATSWRLHIAGYRGNQPGVVGKVIMEAGKQMGYEVYSQSNSAFVGAGRRAWTQILFTRKQTKNSFRPLVAFIPWGEADVLLGWDREEVLRSIDPKGSLQVASQERTYAVVNVDPLEGQNLLEDVEGMPAIIDVDTLRTSCIPEGIVLKSFALLAKYRFHNERLGDLIQLGMAYQLGYVPVTVDAINAAIQKVQRGSFARSVEAFDFGRRAALDSDTTWQPIKEEFTVDIRRLIKRSVRDYYALGNRGVAKAQALKKLIRQAEQSLPGLTESIDGRQAMIDLVSGLRRCMLWGGEEIASRYLSSICKIYSVDKSDNGRKLTCKIILPLAETILIRDPIYLARLARSPEIIRRIRTRLNVRHSRGDAIERRFLSRLRIRIWRWSVQIDMRTSDWSSALVSWVGVVVPKRWRGHKRDRSVQELMLHSVTKASLEPDHYDLWVKRFSELKKLALQGELHQTSEKRIATILES